jgi:hypothetical protein
VRLDIGLDTARGTAQAILLRREHVEQLPPPGELGAQHLALGIRQRPRRRPHRLGNVREPVGIQGVGLGQPAGGFRKIPRVAGIDHHDGQPHSGQGSGDGDFQATSGL